MSALPSRVRVAVLGAGSWGTALATLACTQADTLLWARKPEMVRAISSEHVNAAYLPGISLPAALQATDSLQQALEHVCPADRSPGLIMLGVPVAGLVDLCSVLAKLMAD